MKDTAAIEYLMDWWGRTMRANWNPQNGWPPASYPSCLAMMRGVVPAAMDEQKYTEITHAVKVLRKRRPLQGIMIWKRYAEGQGTKEFCTERGMRKNTYYENLKQALAWLDARIV